MAANEKVGIEIELIGGEEAHRLLQSLDNDIDRLNKRKAFRSLSGLNKSKAELEDYVRELERLNKLRQTKIDNGLSTRSTDKAIANTTAKIKDMSRAYDEATSKAKTFGQTMRYISTRFAHVGSAMQSLGNSLTRLTSPFRRLTSGLLMGAGYKALNLFTEGLSNSFERADTMKNYDRTLTALSLDVSKTFSIAGKEAKTAKANLDDAVQGLPTSLDEIMAAQKVYAGATGEMVSSTKTAIAANNTVLASGMGARESRFMQRYLVALASGADLTTMQWQSMARIAPLAMRAVSKELGYADDEYKQFTKDVQSGKVAGQDFLKAFQKVGTSGAIANAARAQTESWSGLFANIRIAVTRMGANTLETLNQTFADKTGRTLLQRLLGWDKDGKDLGDGIRGWINGLSESIQNWIKANPDKIIDFFNELKSIDVKGFLKGSAESMKDFIWVLRMLTKLVGGNDLEKFGKWMPRLSIAGRILTVVGGFLKGTRHLWAMVGTLARFGGRKFMDRLGSSKLGKAGILGKIASFFGKKSDIDAAGEVGKSVTKASPKLISAFKNMALLSGIIAMPTVTAWGVTKAARASVKNFKEMIDIANDINWSDAKKALAGISGFLGGSALAGFGIGKLATSKPDIALYTVIGETIAGVITGIASGFMALDMRLIKTGLTNFVDGVKALTELSEINNDEKLFEKVKNAIGVYNKVAELINGEAPEVVTAGSISGGMTTGLKGIGFFKAFDIKNLAGSIQMLVDMANALKQLSSIELPENAESNAEKITSVASRVANSLGKIGTGFGGVSNVGNAVGSWGIKATMTNIVGELVQLRRMAYHLSALSSVSISASAETNVSKLINTTVKIANKLGKLRSGFGGWGNMVSSGGIKTTMTNIADQLIQLRRMAYHINKLSGITVNSAGFSTFIQQLKDALADLKTLEGDLELNITVKLSRKFGESVKAVVKDIKSAKKDINDARNDLKNKTSKKISIHIPVSVTFSILSNFGSALSTLISQRSRLASFRTGSGRNKDGSSGYRYQNTGGAVYRARGGGVPFPGRPRGTDTVPVWATPGEYIHNKQAVKAFGIDFMRKVNNLDVRGAMSELMHRAGGMANVNRGTVITNNNYNNQKVTINNNSPTGSGYTFKSASRFVGAL